MPNLKDKEDIELKKSSTSPKQKTFQSRYELIEKLLYPLFSNKWQQAQKSRSFYGTGQAALMLSADTSITRVNNF